MHVLTSLLLLVWVPERLAQEDRTVVKEALGRDFTLGMMYDMRTDSPIPAR